MSLIIKPISANLTKGNDHIFFKKSPYLVAQVGNQIQKTSPCKNAGKSPQWSQTLIFHQLGPILRLTLMDKNTIGHDDILGQGQFELMPAYMHPYISDSRYIDIALNGVHFANAYVSIEYQGNAMNNTNTNINTNNNNNIQQNTNNQYSQISNMLASDISSIAQPSQQNNPNMNNSSYSQNMNVSPSQIKTIPVPIPVPVVVQRTPMSTINNVDISQLGMSHLNNGIQSLSGSRITTIQTSKIPINTITTNYTSRPVVTQVIYTTKPTVTTTTTTTVYRNY